jgi:hypothetical protein
VFHTKKYKRHIDPLKEIETCHMPFRELGNCHMQASSCSLTSYVDNSVRNIIAVSM